MANNFRKIEVHFDTPKGQHSAIVLPETPHVEAIFLGVAESKFLPWLKAKRQIPPEHVVTIDPSLTPEEKQLAIGPGVCYLIDGQLHCW